VDEKQLKEAEYQQDWLCHGRKGVKESTAYFWLGVALFKL